MTQTFADLGLGEDLLRAVDDAGYTNPTPIQAKAIPYVLMGRDILGCAQTGTGKTASFTLPLIDILAQGRARARMPRTVILEPTRELAAQVAENFEVYGKYHKLTMALLIGGVSFAEQDRLLSRGVDVLIATPGRLLDHCERGKVILTDTKILVIDEADRMLDMGFIPDVEKIVSLMPQMRQTLMFSATMPKEIRKLADAFLMNPKEMAVNPPSSTAETVEQLYVQTTHRQKRQILRALIDGEEEVKNALIFCNRKRDVADLHKTMKAKGYPVGALHGDMDQYKRMECLEQFRSGEMTMLICSDVAARGLDIATVSHVYNFDVPVNSEDYVHRIGRTGRAGRSGKAVTLVTKDDFKAWAAVRKIVKKDIPEHIVEGFAPPAPASSEEMSEDTAPKKRSRRSKTGRAAKAEAEAAVSDTELDAAAPTETDEETTTRKTRGRNGRKSTKETDAAGIEPDGAANGGKERNRRRRRGSPQDEVGEIEEMDVPYGQSSHVPAFLLR